jgi:hypothetical protein
MQNQDPASMSSNDYVSSYKPPVQQQPQVQQQQQQPPAQQQTQSSPQSTSDALAELEKLIKESEARQPAAPANQSATPQVSNQVAEDKPQPVVQEPTVQEPAAPKQSSNDQPLEKENIFFLLGVEDGSTDEKEKFLDELQEVIWEDFVENDVELLLTSEELENFKKIQATGQINEPKVQEAMLTFLEKLIPDLEEIMLEKALELKEDLVMERVKGMEEYFAGNEEALSKVNSAKQMLDQNLWHDAAALLNTVK